VKQNIAVPIIVLALVAAGVFAWQQGRFDGIIPSSSSAAEAALFDLPADAQAAGAGLVAFYTIDYQESPDAWAERVCAVSTEQGREIATNFFASAVAVNAAQHSIQTSATVIPVAMVDDLGEEGRIWQVRVSMTNPWDADSESTEDAFVHVVYDGSQWLYERTLFAQEAERYQQGGANE